MKNDNNGLNPVNQEERSYFQKRVFDEMGLTPEQNQIMLRYDFGDSYRSDTGQFDIFSEDKHGNIKILVYTISGDLIQYEDPYAPKSQRFSDNQRLKRYEVTRINPANMKEDDDKKYVFPKGQGVFPFFPPNLLKKFREKENIDTLVLTEGYFKAMCASLHGLNIVGLGSITHYADSNTRELHSDIKRLINACNVKKVVLLYDGDCINLSMKDVEKGRDLSRRPTIFYNSIINTRDLLIDFNIQIEFAYVRTEHLIGKPKGIDDLFMEPAYLGKHEAIVKDLTEEHINAVYFFRMNVRDQVKRLKKQFFIDTVQSFYRRWKDVLGEKEFIYEHMIYQWDSKEEKVKRSTPADIRNYIRVGDEYYEMIEKPSIRTEGLEKKLERRNKGTIIDDFGRDAMKMIRKFKAFVNMPSHINYKAVIANCWNQYHPLNYHEEPNCPWPHIQYLMEHIFGEQIEIGYDYMQLLYLHPTQILPILCLVSRERQTGKTSFLDLLREIFSYNCVVVGNGVMQSEFNALVSGKLLVCCDEAALGDNHKFTEYIKMMSTAKHAALQRKGRDHEEIENFTKYVLCANDETHFIYAGSEETRFWVRKINPMPGGDIIGNIIPIFSQEIPGFLSFLISRKMHIEKDNHSRMWFSAEDIHTEALDNLKRDQIPKPMKAVREVMRQLFIDFPAWEYIISTKIVKEMVPEVHGMSSDALRTALRDHLGVKSAIDQNGVSKSRYIKVPYYNNKHEMDYRTDKAKGFRFFPEFFLEPHELEYLKSMLKDVPNVISDIVPIQE